MSAPGTQAATPPKAQKTQPTLFSLSVARLGDKATVYVFDQPTLAIGRGRECDLRLEHDGFSRRQVILQRSVTSTGSPRFRLIPQKTSNPTYVNGQPLVEGAVKSGDVIAVADVRITFTRGKAEDEVVAARRRRKRALLMAATVVMVAAFVSTLISARSSVAADTRLTQPQNDLLRDTRGFLCAGTAECATRAREAYHTGKRFLSQSMSDLSYPYRAAVEFQRAMRFRDQSGKPLPEISDVDRYLAETRSWLETEFRDGQFRLSHAMLDNDMQRCADESAYLARILPDENHPYRVKLDDYRRRLPPPRDF